jgi:hypothetical protein
LIVPSSTAVRSEGLALRSARLRYLSERLDRS